MTVTVDLTKDNVTCTSMPVYSEPTCTIENVNVNYIYG